MGILNFRKPTSSPTARDAWDSHTARKGQLRAKLEKSHLQRARLRAAVDEAANATNDLNRLRAELGKLALEEAGEIAIGKARDKYSRALAASELVTVKATTAQRALDTMDAEDHAVMQELHALASQDDRLAADVAHEELDALAPMLFAAERAYEDILRQVVTHVSTVNRIEDRLNRGHLVRMDYINRFLPRPQIPAFDPALAIADERARAHALIEGRQAERMQDAQRVDRDAAAAEFALLGTR